MDRIKKIISQSKQWINGGQQDFCFKFLSYELTLLRPIKQGFELLIDFFALYFIQTLLSNYIIILISLM